MLEIILSVLILVGSFLTLVGSIGLYKLPDFYMRLHGPTKATTLGVGSILVASILYFSLNTEQISVHEILVSLFLFITAPVSALLMAKAARHLKLKQTQSKRTDADLPTKP